MWTGAMSAGRVTRSGRKILGGGKSREAEPEEQAAAQVKAGSSGSAGGKRRIAVEYEAADGTDKKLKWEPKNWRKQLENIRQMRSGRDAPVDQMGAEKCFDQKAEPQVSDIAAENISLVS
ncbi:endonuclease III-like protein 1 [Bufo bufo]|uniref:endonuclease III-like protein 1 n=1 Tax=Bufo bufo TaxID=8384 RepID=UPI001ABE883F|nr:endonuclease III-like protein 1 [Bufo bufo]